MSERKSWDIQPNKPVRKAVQAIPAPPRRLSPTRAPAAAPKAVPQQQVIRSTPLPKGTLKERRKKKRQILRYVWFTVGTLLIAGGFYALWLPALRVQTITIEGPDAEPVKQIVQSKLVGTYGYLVPRNSIFFFSQVRMRASVLDAQPAISAVSFNRTSFSSLRVVTTPRATSFIWCGTSIDTPVDTGVCFDSDIEGYIFKEGEEQSSASSTASTTKNRDDYIHIFSQLDTELDVGQSPLRHHIAYASAIPNALKFVQAMRGLGAPVSALAIRGDEADLWLGSTTRITYVLGHEHDAAELAASALPTLSLTDGTIQYIDLRFPGKVYIKKYGE